VASLAGGLHAPWAQIVTPDTVSYLHSTQPMLNTLLGGSGFFWGPAVGSVIFSTLGYATRTLAGLSELISGTILLLVVLGAPGGILGLGRRLGLRSPARTRPAAKGAGSKGAQP
jgi:branched-chain amino acid transport system permease protein